MEQKIREAYSIVEDAIAQHPTSFVYVGFSGGGDSLAVLEVVRDVIGAAPLFAGCFHANTGIGLEESRQFVRQTCKIKGIPLTEIRAKEDCGQDYEAFVLKNGFPGPYLHQKMYARLKERPIRELKRRCDPKTPFIRERKALMGKQKNGTISNAESQRLVQLKQEIARLSPNPVKLAIATGVRRSESRRRKMTLAGQKGFDVREGILWINPIIDWSTDERDQFLRDRKIEKSPVSQALCMSGECLCGAFAEPGELAQIEFFYPKMGAYLRSLQEKVNAAGFPWGWDEKPPEWWGNYKRGQQFIPGMEEIFMPMCTSCENRYHDGQELLIESSKA